MGVRNGIDLVGWRSCEQQKELGTGRFPLTVAQMAMQVALAPNVPEHIPDLSAAVSADRKRQILQYRQIREGAAAFARGTPECKSCPISGGNPYGCYTFIRRPIDEIAERTLFEFFVDQLGDDSSVCSNLYRDLISKQPESGTPWHTDRGPNGEYAVMATPLEHKWGFFLRRKRVDTAQILAAMFFTQKRVGLIAVFARFWREFMLFARGRGVPVGSSTTLMDFGALEALYRRVDEHAAQEASVAIIIPD
jgi:hypothetical protein